MGLLEDCLAGYAARHRDRRNIALHVAGVPLVLFAIVLALALVSFPAEGVEITLAAVASIAAGAYYLLLDRILGAALAIALFVLCAAASEVTARLAGESVLALAVALFAAGWALQARGHRLEGVKTALLGEARQILTGPLFVCAEVFFLFGAREPLRRELEARVGPTLARRDRSPASGTR